MSVCVSVCVCDQPENLPSYVHPSTYNIQNVPECSRMHAEYSRMFQNAWRMFRNACRIFKNVPESSRLFQNACMKFHEPTWSFKSLYAVSWACMQFLSLSEQLTRISQCLFFFYVGLKLKWNLFFSSRESM